MIFEWILITCYLQCYAAVASETTKNKPPHIITIIADDLGWNDVGFHGSNQIPTPNIDALAYNGIIFNSHYTQPTCTPSRAALLTGKYPIRYGLQGPPLYTRVRAGLPLNEKILPQYLKELGYVTRLVGKWHLGYYKYDFTPLNRGFDSHLGYYNGWMRYNDTVSTDTDLWGYDARDGHKPAADRFRGKYATDVFNDEAVNIIKNHDTSRPLFLDLSHVAVHALDNDILQVRNQTETDEKFSYIKDAHRRTFAGVLAGVDESVGRVVAALDERKMLQNSIILFISDNGGATVDTNKFVSFKNSASNWPLRGWKGSLTEGGVRGVAAIWSPLLNSSANTVSDQILHITDWLPTFYAAAGGDVHKLGNIDGRNQWHYLTGKQNSSAHKEVLLNINEKTNDSALIIGDWKYIRLSNPNSIDFVGESGQGSTYSYNMDQVLLSKTQKLLENFSKNKNTSSQIADQFKKLRKQSTISHKCSERIQVVQNTAYSPYLRCFQKGCLFNIKNDPCEFNDLSENEIELQVEFEKKINQFRQELVPQQEFVTDPECDPRKYNNYWTPWFRGDVSFGSICSTSNTVVVFSLVLASFFVNFALS